jgi:hypothetical protein
MRQSKVFSGDYEADISDEAKDIKVMREKGRGEKAEGRKNPQSARKGRVACRV